MLRREEEGGMVEVKGGRRMERESKGGKGE